MATAQHMEDMRNLKAVRNGVKHRCAGIRKCSDCGTAFIGRNKNTKYCDQHREQHVITCTDCGARFIPSTAKTTKCRCCENQNRPVLKGHIPMLKVSMPIAFTPEEIWVFAEIGDHCVGARVAITDTNAVVLALPCDQFDINGLFPTYPETGDLIPGVRWANADDMNSHPGSFTNQ